MRWWRQMWDVGFASGSLLSSFFIGVAMGNSQHQLDFAGQSAYGSDELLRSARNPGCCLAERFVRFAPVNPLIRAAKWADAAFHPPHQAECCAFLFLPGVPAHYAIQTDSGQGAVESGWSLVNSFDSKVTVFGRSYSFPRHRASSGPERPPTIAPLLKFRCSERGRFVEFSDAGTFQSSSPSVQDRR